MINVLESERRLGQGNSESTTAEKPRGILDAIEAFFSSTAVISWPSHEMAADALA